MPLKEFVELVAEFIISHIAVSMPLILVIAKLLMVRLAANKEAQKRNILRIPEELSYIALSFVLAGLSGELKGFNAYFSDTPHPKVSTALLLVPACMVCMWMHFVESRWLTPSFQRWRAAHEKLDLDGAFGETDSTKSENYKRIIIHNLAALSVSFIFLSFAPAAVWLWLIAGIVSRSQ